MSNPSTEQQCGHTKLYVDDFRGPQQIKPCLWCERDRLRHAVERIATICRTSAGDDDGLVLVDPKGILSALEQSHG